MRVFIGIDLGTTHIKAVALDEGLAPLACAIRRNRLVADASTGDGYDPETLYATAMDCVRAVLADASVLGPLDVAAIGVTGMAEAGLLLDSGNHCLSSIIPWNHQHARAQVRELEAALDPFALYAKTGLIPNPKHVLPKLLWLREHRAGTFARARRWLSVPDYVVLRLSGEMATDYSLASRTMCFDTALGRWDAELSELCGGLDLFPQALPLGSVAGHMRPALAAELGLKGELKIVLAGHDHVSAALAVGARPGSGLSDSMGTSEAMLGLESEFRSERAFFECGVNQGRIGENAFYWMANIPASGASVEWFNRTIGGGEDYAALEHLGSVDSDGVFFFPYLNGAGTPEVAPGMRGVFAGLGPRTCKAAMLRAIYEGVSFQNRWILQTMAGLLGRETGPLRVFGGSTRNAEWMRVKANVLGVDIECVGIQEPSATGAALLAARACGIEAASGGNAKGGDATTGGDATIGGEGAASSEARFYRPDPALKDHYDERYEAYRKLVPHVRAMSGIFAKE